MKNFRVFFCRLPTSLRFAIAPLLTIVVGKTLFERLAFDFPQLSSGMTDYFAGMGGNVPVSATLLESKARMLWMTAVLLYFFVNAGYFSFLWNTLKKNANDNLTLLLVITGLISAVEIYYLSVITPSQSPIKNIFHFTFDALSASTLVSPNNLLAIQITLNIINLLAIIVVPLTIVTCCGIIGQSSDNIKDLEIRFNQLKDLIKGSSAIMITGIIHMQLWLSWPLGLMSDFDEIKSLKEVILTVIQYWGICYSLTIAALYLPVSSHLRNLARNRCKDLDGETGLAKLPPWLDDNPGVQSASARIPQLVAILGPMLVGTLSPAMTDLFSF